MTWGPANDLLTVNGFRLLAARCGHPTHAELLKRIAAQEARHYSFYMLQAEWRLTASPLAVGELVTDLTGAMVRRWTTSMPACSHGSITSSATSTSLARIVSRSSSAWSARHVGEGLRQLDLVVVHEQTLLT